MDSTHSPHIRHNRHHHWLAVGENLSLPVNTTPAFTSEPTFSYPSSDSTFTLVAWNDSYISNYSNATQSGANESKSEVDPVVYAAFFLIIFCTVSLAINVIILSSVCFMRTRCTLDSREITRYRALILCVEFPLSITPVLEIMVTVALCLTRQLKLYQLVRCNKPPFLINPTLYISLSLAGADTFSLLFFALGLLFFSLLPRLGVSLEAPCAMLMLEALRMGAIMTTLFHLAALAGNHYLGILLPLHYPVYMARRNIQYGLVILWTIPSCIMVLCIFFLEGDGFKMCPYDFLKKSRFRIRFCIPFFTTLGMMTFIYIHIYRLVCKHQRQPLDGKYRRCQSTKRSGGFSRSQVNEKAIVTTLMILGSTIFGWTPAFTHYALICEDCVLSAYYNLKTPGETAVLLVVNFLLIGKTATNSYIYAFRMKEIKIALRRMRRRLLMRLFHVDNVDDQSDWAAGGLTRTTSRQSTTRSRTFVYRMNSLQDSTLNNGVSKQPPIDPSLRRCQSVTCNRHKQCSTSV